MVAAVEGPAPGRAGTVARPEGADAFDQAGAWFMGTVLLKLRGAGCDLGTVVQARRNERRSSVISWSVLALGTTCGGEHDCQGICLPNLTKQPRGFLGVVLMIDGTSLIVTRNYLIGTLTDSEHRVERASQTL